MPFVAGASGDPKDTRFRIGSHANQDIDEFLTPVDTRTHGIDFGYQHTPVDPLKILPGGVPPQMIDGKMPLDPFTIFPTDVDPGDPGLLECLANVFGTYDVATASSRSRWRFGLDEGTDANRYLKFLADNGVTPRMRVLNARLEGFDLEAQANSNFAVSFPGLGSRYDFFEDPVQQSGSGSTSPTVHGVLPGQTHDEDNATPDSMWLEVQSVSGNTVVWKASIASSAPTYGSETFTVTAGSDVPVPAIDSDTGLVLGGDPGYPLLVSLPDSPTLTASDEFEIAVRRAEWTPSFATLRSLPSRNVRMIVDDEEFRFEGGFSVSARWENFSLQSDVPGAQGGTVRRSGVLGVTIEITREIRDLLFERTRIAQTRVPVVINAVSADIIPSASNLPFRFGVVCPAMSVGGQSYRNEAGATNTEETATLTAEEPDSAYSYDGRSWDSHAHVFVDNGITALVS